MSGQPRRHSKSVHFAQNDTHIHEGTPSPTLTSSTLSSPELCSPLPLPHLTLPNSPVSPVGQSWSPASPSTALFLHPSPTRPNAKLMSLDLDPYLKVPPTNQLPHFTFDLTRDPQGMGIRPALPKAVLDQPAVQPPVAKMSITITSEAFQWVVEIKPGLPDDNERPKEYVTVKDVLYGIYKDLQSKLNEVDQEKMSRSVLEKAGLACQLRRERIKLLEKRNESAGLKRVDLLYKSHRFKGLAVDRRNGNWVLDVEDM
ncbi:hypothetical protein H1R20_g14144, partial [Candolleomyces eurysporus]